MGVGPFDELGDDNPLATTPRTGETAAMPIKPRPPRVNEFGQPIGDPVGDIGARRPQPTSLVGRTCRLDPLALADAEPLLDALLAGAGDEQWTYMSYGPCRTAPDQEDVIRGLLDSDDVVPFAIRDHAGTPVGTASFLRLNPSGGTIEVGHIMYGAGARRAAPATEAMYLLARHVFEDLGYRRYEWKCDALNAASRAAADRLGFRFEGVWRKAMAYKGRNRDTAWYAMTDDDWARLRPAYDAWLAGLDEHGRQGAPLAAREALAG